VSLLTIHNTNIHVPGGISTRNPSKRSASNPRPSSQHCRHHTDYATPPPLWGETEETS
jgi:hypothetical protein